MWHFKFWSIMKQNSKFTLIWHLRSVLIKNIVIHEFSNAGYVGYDCKFGKNLIHFNFFLMFYVYWLTHLLLSITMHYTLESCYQHTIITTYVSFYVQNLNMSEITFVPKPHFVRKSCDWIVHLHLPFFVYTDNFKICCNGGKCCRLS